MTQLTPVPNSFWKLRMLRTKMAVHNPDSEDVVTIDWAIHTLEKAQEVGDRAAYLSGCLR